MHFLFRYIPTLQHFKLQLPKFAERYMPYPSGARGHRDRQAGAEQTGKFIHDQCNLPKQ